MARWWELATERAIHCPAGHHIPAVQRINETGFIACTRKMKLPPLEDALYIALKRGERDNAARAEAALIANGRTVPSLAALEARVREATTGVECGLWVFILAIRGSGVVVAQVSLDEMEEMRELHTPMAMLEYLRIWPSRRSA